VEKSATRRSADRGAGGAAVAHPEGARPAHPGAKSERQATGNAGALSFTLADAEIEALDQATTAWRR
jgi:aryl-alcohol dehydrogenase-like predicted oxidoreductase